MKTIHPFPARMAPEIALEAINGLEGGASVVDPMCGSGTVLRKASELGYESFGIDIDPLSVLHAKVWTSKVDEEAVTDDFKSVRENFLSDMSTKLPAHIDLCPESQSFITFWFSSSQRLQLSKLIRSIKDTNYEDLYRIALSRLIITKSPVASLARDTSHSRPHKVICDSTPDLLTEFQKSVRAVLKRLEPDKLTFCSSASIGDARRLPFPSFFADAIVTSPPYLNAIDYMRGHRLSLVWLGFPLDPLKIIRSGSVGSQKSLSLDELPDSLIRFLYESSWYGMLDTMTQGTVRRYSLDAIQVISEYRRILKPTGRITLVVGNSTIKGTYIPNSEIFKFACKQFGLVVKHEVDREIPANKRYLPVSGLSTDNSLEKRMRRETILTIH